MPHRGRSNDLLALSRPQRSSRLTKKGGSQKNTFTAENHDKRHADHNNAHGGIIQTERKDKDGTGKNAAPEF
jgi:hypothetical protein